MFEYLMPRLLLPTAPEALLDSAQQAAVARQIDYGKEQGLPWGVSESGFYFLDAHQDYQYQSFGVPGLGLKRDLSKDRVIAPYASLLAAGIAPHEVLQNIEALRATGGEGPFGFYEAIDFTVSRQPPQPAGEGLTPRQRGRVVRSYMAHHQGRAFGAVATLLTQDRMPRRLHGDPRVRSADLLLEERLPMDVPMLEPNPGDEVGE